MLHPRARTMLLLSTPALIIGIASSLVLIAVMKVASVLQQFLWERLPVSIGIANDSPVWIIGMLTLTGIMVGLVIRYSQGHAGPDPACEPLIGMPVSGPAGRTDPRPRGRGQSGARASDYDREYRAGSGHWRSAVSPC